MTSPQTGADLAPQGVRPTERFQQAVLPMVMLTLDGVVFEVNTALCSLLELPREQLLGTSATALEPGASAWPTVLEAVRAGEPGGEVEQRLHRLNGEVLDVQAAWTLLRDDAGRPSYLTAILVDVTESRRQQALLVRSEARFRARFERSSVAQAIVGLDGVVTAANEALCALLGRPQGELLGSASSSLRHPHDDGEADGALARLLAGELDSLQYGRVFADGQGRPVPTLVDVTLLRDADGRPDEAASHVQDLRAVRDLERRREQQEQFFLAVGSRANDLAIIADADGHILYASAAAGHLFGRPAAELLATQGWDLVHRDDRAAAQAVYADVVRHGGTRTFVFRLRHANGQWRWVEETATNLLHSAVGGIVANIRDITDQVEAERSLRQSEARFRAMADSAEEGIWLVSEHGQTLYANGQMADILGLTAAELPGLDAAAQLGSDEGVPAATQRDEVGYAHPDGAERRLWVVTSPLPGPDGTLGTVRMVSDVTEARRAEQQLRRAALHDGLTGLPNRTLLLDRLEQALTRELGAGVGSTAVLFIDLDHFQLENEARGHEAGDNLLMAVAERLVAGVRPRDTVARFGGDEFVVVCEDVDDAGARVLAEGLRLALGEPYEVAGSRVHATVSIGVAISPGASAEDLLRHADAALRLAKAKGRARVEIFDTALAEAVAQRYALAGDLREALQRDELRLHYQPVVDLATGAVLSVEALARWRHPDLGEVSPAVFVPVAEQAGLAVQLDTWALRRATAEIADLRARGVLSEQVGVAVNLSARTLADPRLEQSVVDAVASAGLSPDQIMLEITESAVMDDAEQAVRVLGALRERGYAVAVDDFGTGYSSLSYLRTLPLTVIKVDRSFVAGIADDRDVLAIVASIVDLARAVGVTVIAEGVETPEQAALLRRLGCDSAQGWLWSPALSVEQVRKAANTWRAGYPTGAARPQVPPGAGGRWDVLPEHGAERLFALHRAGASLATVAAALNSEGFRTPVGARWHRTTVARTIAQVAYPDLADRA